MRKRMTHPPLKLNRWQRDCVRDALRGVCIHRNWELLAVHVRTNHVHAVLAAPAPPEKAMNDLKAWATRRLREAGLIAAGAKVWSRHGSTRHLWDDRAVENACRYVIDGQGADLG